MLCKDLARNPKKYQKRLVIVSAGVAKNNTAKDDKGDGFEHALIFRDIERDNLKSCGLTVRVAQSFCRQMLRPQQEAARSNLFPLNGWLSLEI